MPTLILVRPLPLQSRSLPSHIGDVSLIGLSPTSHCRPRVHPVIIKAPQDLNCEQTFVGLHNQHWIAQHR
jgi:hypothetical protein